MAEPALRIETDDDWSMSDRRERDVVQRSEAMSDPTHDPAFPTSRGKLTKAEIEALLRRIFLKISGKSLYRRKPAIALMPALMGFPRSQTSAISLTAAPSPRRCHLVSDKTVSFLRLRVSSQSRPASLETFSPAQARVARASFSEVLLVRLQLR